MYNFIQIVIIIVIIKLKASFTAGKLTTVIIGINIAIIINYHLLVFIFMI